MCVTPASLPSLESQRLLAILNFSGVSRNRVRRALAPLFAQGLDTAGALTQLRDPSVSSHLSNAQGDKLWHHVRTTAQRHSQTVSWMSEERVQVLRLGSPDFPALLTQIPDPPLVLFVQGSIEALGRDAVSIVGARRCSRGSALFATEIAARIAIHCTVVSGLARGVDGAAHVGALRDGGTTVAVLGCGHEYCYPASHRRLAADILAQDGALVSEYPPTWPPQRRHFPERNRIVSGLGSAVLVIEASERSGSLITARLALEQGREVLAVPGPVAGGMHSGCHRLLKEGAALVETEEDVFAALGIAAALEPVDSQPALSAAQSRLLGLLGGAVRATEELVAEFGAPAGTTLGLLSELELKGFVEATGGGYIRRPFR